MYPAVPMPSPWQTWPRDYSRKAAPVSTVPEALAPTVYPPHSWSPPVAPLVIPPGMDNIVNKILAKITPVPCLLQVPVFSPPDEAPELSERADAGCDAPPGCAVRAMSDGCTTIRGGR